ncbi:MAG: S1 family peptidase [Polyangiaceae bacterium]|nr:S1 family peptidase [Polyangiaceae bacterium]
MVLPETVAPAPSLPPSLRRSDDYVVRIVAGKVSCTGTLIDEQRVLTAHHCVAERNEGGHTLDRDVSPQVITVELGGDYLPWGEVGVKAVVAPPCGYQAGVGDLAILVLTRRLSGFPTARVELDRMPMLGESIEPVGFGRCALSGDGLSRKLRPGGAISAVTADNFRLLAGICPGDSGGPALSREHRLLGLVSQSAMDGDESTLGESEFTRLDRWRTVFANSAAIAQGVPAAALPPVECTAPGAL